MNPQKVPGLTCVNVLRGILDDAGRMIERVMTKRITTLDVREDFRSGQHPCDKIQNALAQVGDGEGLRLLVPFEPVPLFEVARNKGLTHEARQTPDGDWEVLFSHGGETGGQTARPGSGEHARGCGCHETTPAQVVEVDARHLEPPQPMVKILEALTALPGSAVLSARTDRRPIHLYPMLENRGFTGESEEQPDGSFITHIRRI
jgi:uncharacterized protein (DUF2249 family)